MQESAAVLERASVLLGGHEQWRATRYLMPYDAGFPGVRSILIHSFAHLLIRELAAL